MASILVIGGAGYVGSAAVAWLRDRGHEVTIVDDLSTGRRPLLLSSDFLHARAGDVEVEELLASRRFDGILHFAAKSLVAESVAHPEIYWENNLEQTQKLLSAMLRTGHRKIVFSSTCAIFGDPRGARLSEDSPKNPINPYGETKLAVETLLERLSREEGLQAISLRYFNAAGADPDARVGEWHEPETHLIPNLFRAIRSGEPVKLYRSLEPTPDQTCIRDYIHVSDLAQAHEAALLRLVDWTEGGFEAYNLGSETGFSVLEVYRKAQEILGRTLPFEMQPPRPGDPPILVADSSRARKALHFLPHRSTLQTILEDAWRWEERRTTVKKVVFLDRDGTLNFDPGYLRDEGSFHLMPGVPEALQRLTQLGYHLIVVSNQSGVGRGIIPLPAVRRIHLKLDQLLERYGVRILDYFLCFHRPEEKCECRKPMPQLVLRASKVYGIDLSQSFMVGDRISDTEMGKRAGLRASVLVETGEGSEEVRRLEEGQYSSDLRPQKIVRDLGEVANWLESLGST
jgi:UDP-glucose 4-epimerase